MKVRMLGKGEEKVWDAYVLKHPKSTLCHLAGWRRVFEHAYGHKSYYLLAEEVGLNSEANISGVLPLVHIKSLLFGNSFVSMPFLNYGGLLADDAHAEKLLVEEAAKLGRQVKVKNIELRHIYPISWINEKEAKSAHVQDTFTLMTHKVRMVLDLPESSTRLFESFKSKLRSQIRKPQKDGLIPFIGGEDLLDEYYQVFSINMRDLGSPVHSKKLFECIFKEFGSHVRLGVVKYNQEAVAAGLIFCFRDGVEIIWASSLKSFNHLNPNMLLYWSFLEYVTDAKYKQFDFGRSTPDEGTYKFKEQWGAKPSTLYWYENGLRSENGRPVEKTAYRFRQKGEELWQKMPLFLANAAGPMIRKNIPL